MGRSVLAVLAGAIVWSILWIGTTNGMAAALPDIVQPDRRLEHVPVLTTYIVLSLVFSIVAGYATAAVARTHPISHAAALGVLQVALGVYFELSYWELLPVWYHIAFLLLLFPGNVLGGWWQSQRRSAAPVMA